MQDIGDFTSQNSKKSGAGTVFICHKTHRMLLNFRSGKKTHPHTWALWGGMIENEETPKECLLREMKEEMGVIPIIDRIYPFDVYENKSKNFKYYSFVSIVDNEFIPILNQESAGYGWFKIDELPTPLHFGAKITFCNRKTQEKLHLILQQYEN